MKKNIEIFKYQLPFVKPFILRDRIMSSRTGLVLKLSFPELPDVCGYGEAAPLAGFSRETLDEAVAALLAYAQLEEDSGQSREDQLQKVFGKNFHVRSPLFAYEQAMWSMPLDDNGDYFSRMRKRNHVSVCKLLSGSFEDVLHDAMALRAEGYKAAKLKVGRMPVREEVELVTRVSEILGPDIRLRLDANRGWDYETAVAFWRRVEELPIEYIEEPLADIADIHRFKSDCTAQIAADESLVEWPPLKGPLSPLNWANVVVLKPTLLLGLSGARGLARQALDNNIMPVVSACFESGLGIAALAHLAADITMEDIPAGLDTYEWLDADILDQPLKIKQGMLNLDETAQAVNTFNTDRLERIYP